MHAQPRSVLRRHLRARLPATAALGTATLPILWPDGRAGASMWLQVWQLERAGPAGLVATNGTRAGGA